MLNKILGFKAMADGEDGKQGLGEAHTQGGKPVTGSSAADQVSRADLGAAVQQIAAELADAPEQFDLLAQDTEPVSTLGLAGEIVARRNRGRGRPPGAANLRNDKVFDYLQALGHQDPATTLSLLQTADTEELARMLGCEPIEVLREQAKAAAKLMEFKYAKKPATLQLDTGGSGLPVMVIGGEAHFVQNNTQINIDDPSAGVVRNQGLSIDASVRREDEAPHDETKPLKNHDE